LIFWGLHLPVLRIAPRYSQHALLKVEVADKYVWRAKGIAFGAVPRVSSG
jgi:hypothetical protein